MRSCPSRPGAALLEAIVSIAIIGLIGLSGLVLTREAFRSEQYAWDAESELSATASLMSAVSVWTRRDLERRLGARGQGPWLLEIQRITPTLFDVVLWDASATRRIAETTVFRER